LLGLALAACGSVADQRKPSTTVEVSTPEPEASDSSDTSEVVEAPVVQAAHGGEPAATSSPGERGCGDVCATLEKCAGAPLAGCTARCSQSAWVETHDLNCLALRIYWIDEEGCAVMLRTYESFSTGDDCSH
jgi:hypothetical protein